MKGGQSLMRWVHAYAHENSDPACMRGGPPRRGGQLRASAKRAHLGLGTPPYFYCWTGRCPEFCTTTVMFLAFASSVVWPA
jgi:hypothetical protein